METLFSDIDGIPGNQNINFYKWTTQQPTMQIMQIVLRIKVPDGFVAWQATPVNFTYKTDTALSADNKLDVIIEDTNGNPVPLTGATNLVSPTFTTANIIFGGAPVWTPGQNITVIIKTSATNIGAAYADKLNLNYNGR